MRHICLIAAVEPDQPSARRERILESAVAALVHNPRASMADVAAAAGIGRATLHRYFPSRADLVVALARRSIEEIDRACAQVPYYSQTATQSLHDTIEAVVPLGSRYAFLAAQGEALEDSGVLDEVARHRRETRQLMEAVVAEGAFGPEVPMAWLVASFDALIYGAWHAIHEGTLAPADAAPLVFRTLTRGLGPQHG